MASLMLLFRFISVILTYVYVVQVISCTATTGVKCQISEGDLKLSADCVQ